MKTITYIFALIGLVTVLRSNIVRFGLSCATDFLAASMTVPVEVNDGKAGVGGSVAAPAEISKPKSISLDLPTESEPKAAQADAALRPAGASVDESETEAADVPGGQRDGAASTIDVLRMYERAENSARPSEE